MFACVLSISHSDLARCLVDLDAPRVDERDARRIVAAVLESLEPLQQQGGRLPRSRVAYDTAHSRTLPCPHGNCKDKPLAPLNRPQGRRISVDTTTKPRGRKLPGARAAGRSGRHTSTAVAAIA